MNEAADTDLDDVNRPQFSVFLFYGDGSYHTELNWQWLNGRTATQLAVRLALKAHLNAKYEARPVTSIIITDGGDCTVWEWTSGQGVTFPPELAGQLKD